MISLEYLNNNSGAFTVIFTLAVALATMIYAILTIFLVKENRKIRTAQTEPRISITLQRFGSLVKLIINNIGFGPAFDVKFTVTSDTEIETFSELKILEETLNNLVPYQKIHLTLGLVGDLNEVPISFGIKIAYKNSSGEINNDYYEFDLSDYGDLYQLEDIPLHSIAEILKDIKGELQDIRMSLK